MIGYIQKLKINNPELKYVFFAFSGHGQNRDGEDIVYPFKNLDDFLPVSEIEKEIKKLDVALTLSIGEKTYDEYEAYKKENDIDPDK